MHLVWNKTHQRTIFTYNVFLDLEFVHGIRIFVTIEIDGNLFPSLTKYRQLLNPMSQCLLFWFISKSSRDEVQATLIKNT